MAVRPKHPNPRRVYNNQSRGYRKLLVATLILFTLVCLVACDNRAGLPQSAGTDKGELEKAKLALEVEQLQLEQQFFLLNKWIGLVGGLLGTVAILWTIAQGYRTLKNQAETQKKLRIAELLSALSDQRAEARVGAARGLTRYADDVVDEILSALKLEESPEVRSALNEVLSRVKGRHIPRIIAANSDTIPARAYYLGRLVQVGATPEFSDALLRLTPFARKLIRKEHRSQFDHGKDFQKQELQRARILQRPEAQENLALVAAAAQVTRLAEGTALVIADLLRAGRKPRNPSVALDLSSANLYRVDLRKSDLSKSLLSDCLMRHIRLDESRLTECDLSGSNLFGALLVNTDLSEAILVGTQLRSSDGRNAKFCRSKSKEAVFSEGHFRSADFREIDAERAKFRKADLRNACFDSGELVQAEFQGADLREATLGGAKCYRAVFIEADLTGACLASAQLGGADLQGAIFRDADLRNADLSGANISNADFRGADITGMILRKARNIESAHFDPDVAQMRTGGSDPGSG